MKLEPQAKLAQRVPKVIREDLERLVPKEKLVLQALAAPALQVLRVILEDLEQLVPKVKLDYRERLAQPVLLE